jgi:hypothetical protein
MAGSEGAALWTVPATARYSDCMIEQKYPPDAANDEGDGTLGNDCTRTMTIDELRASIRPMTVLERVEEHALGGIAMTPTQLIAAKLFLSKTQPDLKAVEVSGEVNHRHTTAEALEAARQRAIQSAQEPGRLSH